MTIFKMNIIDPTQQSKMNKWQHFFKRNTVLLQRFFKQQPAAFPTESPPPESDPTDRDDQNSAQMDLNQTEVRQLNFDEAIALIKKSTAGIKTICSATESDFLNLGGELQSIYTESETLTQKVVAAISADQDQTIRGALAIIQSHAAAALKELNLRHSRLVSDMEGLQAIYSDLDNLNNQSNHFKTVAKNLKMVGLNISIESARNTESRDAFQILAEEITQLAQNVYSVAANVADDTAAVQQNLQSIQGDIAIRMQNLNDLISSAEITVNNALAEVEKLMQLTVEALDSIGLKSKKISEQVGHLVVGIQIHDNISQRVAHINTSFEEAIGYLRTSSDDELPVTDLKKYYGRAAGLNRIQVLQLKNIIDDVSEVEHTSTEALDKLLTSIEDVINPKNIDAGNLDAICQIDSTDSRHPVAVLRRALEELILLFDKGFEDIDRLTAARRQTNQTIAHMGGYIDTVRDINFDIHLKALNAVIKSIRIGETGRAIQAIVNEMKALAEKSNTTIQSVTDIMQDIASASDAMDQSDEKDLNGTDTNSQLLRQGIEGFANACTTFRKNSRNALELGGQLQKKISHVRHGITFFDDLLSTFKRHHADLEKVEELLEPHAGDMTEDWIAEENRMIEQYTMQRERDAHLQMLSGSQESAESSNGKTGEESKNDSQSTDEDLDDNIELF